MTFSNLLLLFGIVFLILLSGFLSGSETAITAASKARIISKIKKGSSRAGFVKKLIDMKETVLSSLLLSNNLVNILATSLATAFFYDLFGTTGIFYATLLMTFMLVLFAEVLPKTYSIIRPNRTAIFIGPIIYYLSKLLYPIVFLINFIVNLILNKKKLINVTDEQSEEELRGVIDLYKTSNPDSEHEKEMLQSILTLNDTTVEEVFTHRKNIFSINSDIDLKMIVEQINKSNFTRIPFWKKNPENIIGLLDKRALNIDLNEKLSNKNMILDHLKKPWFIPETTNLLDQLVLFKKKKEHLSFVIDEYGELLGLITLEDIIEEIVGEIVDEMDDPQLEMKINSQGKIITDGSRNLKDLYKEFDLESPSSNSTTLGGYVMDLAKKIPLYGETINDNYFTYKVLSHSRKQILRLEIKKIN